MKKIYLLMMGVLFLFSCEQSELDFVGDNSTEVASANTRSASSIADFDPIDELREIPVNILNVGNSKNKYLSCNQSYSKVDLFTTDDGSLRQRWYIKNRGVASIAAEKLPALGGGYWVVGLNRSDMKNPTLVTVGLGIPFAHQSTVILINNNHYKIGASDPSLPYIELSPSLFLQADWQNSSTLQYKKMSSTNLALWEIVPVGEFEIVNMEYVQTSVDNLTPKEVICARDEYTNTSSSTVTWDYSVVTKYSEKSDFSKTEGVTMGITRGLKVGLPNLLGVINLETNMSVQQQTNKSWTYGESSTKDITETRTGHIPVPPNTTIKLDATLVMYEGNLTYVATLRKVGDSKTFKVKGKWSGTCFSMFKAKTYDAKSRSLLGVYSLE